MAHNYSGPPPKTVSIEHHSRASWDPRRQLNYILTCHTHIVRVTVTSVASVVCRWVNYSGELHRTQLEQGRLVVGLGVEGGPSNVVDNSESQYSSDVQPTAATLHLCVGHRCLIFQLSRCNTRALPELRSFLSHPKITFVGIWNNMDKGMLKYSRHRLEVARLLDVADMYRVRNPESSMEILAEEVLGVSGVEKDEDVGRSHWDDEWLAVDQVMDACLDAFIARSLGVELRVWTWAR